jgi:hypothetical protein
MKTVCFELKEEKIMYIKNQKAYLTCLWISIICTAVIVILLVTGADAPIVDGITLVAFLGGVVSGILCGILTLIVPVVKWSFWIIPIIPLNFVIAYFGLMVICMLAFCLPGVAAIICWLKYKDNLYSA